MMTERYVSELGRRLFVFMVGALCFAVIISGAVFAVPCSAMKLGEPVYLGYAIWQMAGGGGFRFEKETKNDRMVYTTRSDGKQINLKGIAMFGRGSTAICCHYSDNKISSLAFGDKSMSNTLSVGVYMGDYIYSVTSDDGEVFFIITESGDVNSEFNIIGRKKDGTFVRYVDSRGITKKYLGVNSMQYDILPEAEARASGKGFRVNGDTIIFSYYGSFPRDPRRGEFRFRWDENAQWFGVEHVRY